MSTSELPIPQPLPNPDWSKVSWLARTHLSDIAAGKHDEDTEHYIYEEVMNAVFGPDVWAYINAKLR